jgi:hypothetical protein
MADHKAVEALLLGKEAWDSFRLANQRPNLSAAGLEGRDLAGFDFGGADLSDARLAGADLSGALLANVNLANADLAKASLAGASLVLATLQHATLAKVRAAGVDLSGANLGNATLDGADFAGAIVNDTTRLNDASVVGCRMERRTLIRMPNWGGLTAGQMMDMDVIDPVAEMRSYYSGFWQWIHFTALALFLGPYVVFLARKYLVARFGVFPDTIPLWRALGDFIWTGGTGEFAPWTFAAFWFSVSYNVLRTVLLFKTKSLELDQDSSGMPARFSLAGRWGKALKIAKVSFSQTPRSCCITPGTSFKCACRGRFARRSPRL